MNLTFRSGDIIVGRQAFDITVGLGRKFVLELSGPAPGRVRWTTENDPVLDVREAADKLSAKVRATEIGVGYIYLTSGLTTQRVTVTVVPMNDPTNEAVTLGGTIGEQSPDV